MPFMLQSCGHAQRFLTPEGICRRCTTDELHVNGEEENGDGEAMDVVEIDKPIEKSTDKEFSLRVEKLLSILINSEDSEISDAVSVIAKTLATSSANERADFISQLVIAYCEARREDQPKIVLLLKDLAKKSFLASKHFLQSAKSIAGDIQQLVIDWPNIYDCSSSIYCSCLELYPKPKDEMRSLQSIFSKSPTDYSTKYLAAFHRHCPYEDILPRTQQDVSMNQESSPSTSPGKLNFIRSPEKARDKIMRPLSQQEEFMPQIGKPPRFKYSREELLKIGELVKKVPIQAAMLEKLMVIKSNTWMTEREGSFGKRTRYGSESATQNEEGPKRILESTSPHLPLTVNNENDLKNHGRPHFEKFTFKHPAPPLQSSVNHRDDHMDQSKSPVKAGNEFSGRNHNLRIDIPQRNNLSSENVRPQHHPQGFYRQNYGRTVSESTAGGDWTTSHRSANQGQGKTKKFLTALSVEKDTSETDSPPITLGPSPRTWASGSGSLKPLSVRQQSRSSNENWRRAAN